MSLDVISQATFYQQMVDYMIANQDKITDFSSGATLDTQLQAFATQLNQAMVKCSGGFKSQFEQIPFEAFSFEREGEQFASTTVVFSRQSSATVEITIPAGTVVGTSGGLLYTTQESATIIIGNTDSNAVDAIANEAGSDYNVFVGTITEISSAVEGVNSVTNNTAASGGQNEESNTDYFTRFSNFILGLSGSNRYGIFTAATGVETIQSAYVEDHFPPVDDIWNFTVYVDDGSGSTPQAKLDEVKLVIYGNDTSSYQGYASAGINFRVLAAGLVGITVEYTVEIDATETDATEISSILNSKITDYINSLWVGSDVNWSEIIRIIKSTSGVTDVVDLFLNGTEENIIVGASQVPRVSTINPTVS